MSTEHDVTLPRLVTDDDYRHFPDDGYRYEILAGEIYVTRAPSPRHQYASKRLQRVLEDYFEGSRGHVVFNASDGELAVPAFPQLTVRLAALWLGQ